MGTFNNYQAGRTQSRKRQHDANELGCKRCRESMDAEHRREAKRKVSRAVRRQESADLREAMNDIDEFLTYHAGIVSDLLGEK